MKPSRARYRVVLLAIGLAVLSYVQRVAISGAAVPIMHDLHLSKQQMGLVFGAFGLAYAVFEIPMGLRGDRLGVRRALAQIVLAWTAFTALTGAAWNLTSLVAFRFLFGAGEAGCFPNLTRMLSAWLPARDGAAQLRRRSPYCALHGSDGDGLSSVLRHWELCGARCFWCGSKMIRQSTARSMRRNGRCSRVRAFSPRTEGDKAG